MPDKTRVTTELNDDIKSESKIIQYGPAFLFFIMGTVILSMNYFHCVPSYIMSIIDLIFLVIQTIYDFKKIFKNIVEKILSCC